MPKKKLLITATIIAAVVLIGSGLYLFSRNKPKTVNGKTNVVVHSTDHPSEDPINKNTYKSTAGPIEPKYITLPTIEAEGFIEKVGVDQDKRIAVPTNIHLAGWYVEALKPGQVGLSIIDGHLDGYKHDGIFKNLAKLKAGDTYTVEKGDGSILNYKVISVQTMSVADANKKLFIKDPSIKSQLNLITCGGAFDNNKKEYDKRVIVVSELQ